MNVHLPEGASKDFAQGETNQFQFSKKQDDRITTHQFRQFKSSFLTTRFNIDVYLPSEHESETPEPSALLIMNDGQDMGRVSLAKTLHQLYARQEIMPVSIVAVHAGERLQEYGVAGKPDYKNRGGKAALYSHFIVDELLPFINNRFSIKADPSAVAYAGFSLGGLSAMDIAWQHPEVFGKIGVFSGSFWWRSKDYTEKWPDANRIMHEILRQSEQRPGMKFWLQAGTMDETSDRNHNGIIDAIDDTLDIIKELKKLGYQPGRDIRYVEIEGGTHHPSTWAKVLPDFLVWAFGRHETMANKN